MAALPLHDVNDVQQLVASIATRSGLRLSYHDREDLEQFLLVECWKLSLRFDGSQGSRFSAHAKFILSRRVVDWTRQRSGRSVWKFAGRTYERDRPQLVSLDADGPDGNRLVDALPGSTGDSPPDRLAARAGLHADGDRQTAEDQALIRRLAR